MRGSTQEASWEKVLRGRTQEVSWGKVLRGLGALFQHFAIRRQTLTCVHLVEMVLCAGVRHMLKDEIQDLPMSGGNGQLLLASALNLIVWHISKGVQCPQRSFQDDLDVTLEVHILLYTCQSPLSISRSSLSYPIKPYSHL